MKRSLAILCVFSSCYLGRLPTATPQEPDKKTFVGKWNLSDPRVKGVITTVEFDKEGSCKPGVWGRDFGGPNGLGANTWKIKRNELEFAYVKPGRAREDSMLTGTIKSINANEFQFTVTGGFYGMGNNRGLVFRFKKI